MVKNEYMKAYMSDKSRIVVRDDTKKLFDALEKDRNFNSANDTLNFLLRLEKELKVKNLLEDYRFCVDCAREVDKDHSQTCPGHISTKYRVKTELSGATTHEDEHSGTINAKNENMDFLKNIDFRKNNDIFLDKDEEADYLAWKSKRLPSSNL